MVVCCMKAVLFVLLVYNIANKCTSQKLSNTIIFTCMCTCMGIIMLLVNMLQYSLAALHVAALNGHQEVVEILVDHGAITQLRNKVGVANISMCSFLCSITTLNLHCPTR